MTPEPIQGTRQFTVGRVLGRSLAVMGREIVPFALAALILGAIQYAVRYWEIDAFALARPAWNAQAVMGRGLMTLSNATVGTLLAGFVTQATLNLLDRKRIDLAGAIARSLSVFPRVLPLMLLYVAPDIFAPPRLRIVTSLFTIAIGLVAWVYVAIIVGEGGGIAAGIRRSLALTRGGRLRIFAILMVIVVAEIAVFFFVGQSLIRLVYRLGHGEGLYLAGAFNTGLSGIFEAFASAAGAVSYRLLRADKEGIAFDQVATVFD